MINARERALASLRGLALGDAFGEVWFFKTPAQIEWMSRERIMPTGPWRWTDDTAMAISLYGQLVERGEIHQDELAMRFADAYAKDPHRNYGPGMHDVLPAIGQGEPWQTATQAQFHGQGSWGNGAAMRVALLGAYFADDLDLVVSQARLSAAVTHAHLEAAAGAIAVAVAAALSARGTPGGALLTAVADATPDSQVATRIRTVADRTFTTDPQRVAHEVGCGQLVSAPDTVPFALWCAARHLDGLADALWTTATAGGDIDTTCAIVGGVVAARTGLADVPAEWLDACEPLPADIAAVQRASSHSPVDISTVTASGPPPTTREV